MIKKLKHSILNGEGWSISSVYPPHGKIDRDQWMFGDHNEGTVLFYQPMKKLATLLAASIV